MPENSSSSFIKFLLLKILESDVIVSYMFWTAIRKISVEESDFS